MFEESAASLSSFGTPAMLEFLFTCISSLITNPLIVIVGWFAGATVKELPGAVGVSAIGATLAQLLALPLLHVFRAMEGPMAAGHWPGNLEFLGSGAVGGVMVAIVIWRYKDAGKTNPAAPSDGPHTASRDDAAKH